MRLELASVGLDLQRDWSSYVVREKQEYKVEISFKGRGKEENWMITELLGKTLDY